MKIPDKNAAYTLPHHNKLVFQKKIIPNPNFIVGDYTYNDDF
ncbi:hypothetical protein ACE1ET_16395 [Saccharicrinis sp. FJH62]